MTAPLSRSEVEDLARQRFGTPNARLSRAGNLRFGTKGSVSVDVATGRWFDHQAGAGGHLLRGDAQQPRPQNTTTAARGVAKAWSREAEEIWRSALPITGTAVELYLRGRGCWIGDVEALRFLRDWHGWPAMLAIVTDTITNTPMTLHFTLLKRDGTGKAPVERPKLLLRGHRKSGGVIRLSPDDEVTMGLGLAEGVETALTVMGAEWRPVWSTIDAGNMRTFPVLGGIEALTVFADHDDAGLTAAHVCATRWRDAGREAVVVTPTGADTDFNDTAGAP
jgi:hypothetical protein